MRLFIIIIFGIFLASGCQEKKSYSTSCPILTGPAGAQLFMSLESARSLCKDRIISVQALKMETSPIAFSFRSGKNDFLASDAYGRYPRPLSLIVLNPELSLEIFYNP